METRTGRFVFVSGVGERVDRQSFVFARRVLKAYVALSGYSAEYVGDDHHLQRLTVMLNVGPVARIDEGWEVPVISQFDLRDENGDDRFSGSIDFILFAETEGLFTVLTDFLGG
jgi:hypothetical protein